MLVIVCILFLITEFPQSVFLADVIIRKNSDHYDALGELMDIIALVNNAINFLLYCTMSRAFRNTFCTLIVESCCFKALKAHFADEKKCTKKANIKTNNFSLFSANSVYALNPRVNNTGIGNEIEGEQNNKNSIKIKHIELKSINNGTINKCSSMIELNPLIKQNEYLNGSSQVINEKS